MIEIFQLVQRHAPTGVVCLCRSPHTIQYTPVHIILKVKNLHVHKHKLSVDENKLKCHANVFTTGGRKLTRRVIVSKPRNKNIVPDITSRSMRVLTVFTLLL